MPVTPEAPAASRSAFETTVVDFSEPHSQVASTDKNYRLTGELPEGRPEDSETPSEIEPESAAGTSETAAASEAAKTAEAQPSQKTVKTSESRWAKLSRENRELREKLARAAQPQTQVREERQESRPAVEAKPADGKVPKPKIDDVDPKTGKALYSTYGDYQAANDQWILDEAVRTLEAKSAKTAAEQRAQQEYAEIGKSLAKKFEGPRAKYADFDTVALGNHWMNPQNSVTDLFLIDSEHAGEVAYYLGQHPEITAGFYDFNPQTGKYANKITPQQQFRKLMEIEAQFASSESAPVAAAASARPITKATRPPHQVSGTAGVTKDAIEEAVERQDSDTFMREQNSRDPRLKAILAARKKG